MNVEETFYRPEPLASESRSLPAEAYNLAHHLVTQAREGCVFVPIRSMQVLAVLDREEFVFIDRERRSLIDIAWQRFHPGQRNSLEDPVAYEAVYYSPGAQASMQRLQGEFLKALRDLEGRAPSPGSARILPLKRPAP
jgi:hypothetical protein